MNNCSMCGIAARAALPIWAPSGSMLECTPAEQLQSRFGDYPLEHLPAMGLLGGIAREEHIARAIGAGARQFDSPARSAAKRAKQLVRHSGQDLLRRRRC